MIEELRPVPPLETSPSPKAVPMIDESFDGVPHGARDVTAFFHDRAEPLELKADESAALAEMAGLLTRMRSELDQQFQTFVHLRDGAMRRAGEDLPDAEAKLARADLKAAVEALSVIVRTLEKVDQLERQLARDRAEFEAAPESREAYNMLWGEVEALIEARVKERLAERVATLDHEHAITPPVHAGAPPGTPPRTEGRVSPETVSGDAVC